MSYPPDTCWVTYANIMWRIKIILHYVIFFSTSSLMSNIFHSTLFPESLVVWCPATVYSNLLISACPNNGERVKFCCALDLLMIGWWLRGGPTSNMGSEPSWGPNILHIPKIIFVSSMGREGMQKTLQWIWPSECYTWCHRNFNTRHVYLCPLQIFFISIT
jgi:hypothetical protein